MTQPILISNTTFKMHGTTDESRTTPLKTITSFSLESSTERITTAQSTIGTIALTKPSETEITTTEIFTKRPMAVQVADMAEAPLVISIEPTSFSISTRSSKALSLDDFLPPELRQEPTTTTNSYITVQSTTSSVTTKSSTYTSTTTTTTTTTTKEKGESVSSRTEKQ